MSLLSVIRPCLIMSLLSVIRTLKCELIQMPSQPRKNDDQFSDGRFLFDAAIVPRLGRWVSEDDVAMVLGDHTVDELWELFPLWMAPPVVDIDALIDNNIY